MRQESSGREMPTRTVQVRRGPHRLHPHGENQPCNEWCRLGGRPWYDQGWFWALLCVGGLALVAWQLGNIHEALEASAESTRQQTEAMMTQTQVMRAQAVWLEKQGAWLGMQLEAVGRAIAALGGYLREALLVLRS